MGILFGLGAAFGYGLADFAATNGVRRIGLLRALFFIQLFGLIGISVAVALTGDRPAGTSRAWLALAGAATVNFAGMLLIYRAFAIGSLSIVSPVASGFAVVTALLALLAGERPPGAALSGVALLMVGVAVISGAQGAGQHSPRGIPEAIGASLSLGIYYWALGSLTDELGVYWPVLVTRLMQLVLAFGVLRFAGNPGVAPDRRGYSVLAIAGLLDTGAMLAFNLGVEHGYTSTTAALTSLYSAVTIALAWVFFHERLRPVQWAGVGVVLTGVLFVSL